MSYSWYHDVPIHAFLPPTHGSFPSPFHHPQISLLSDILIYPPLPFPPIPSILWSSLSTNTLIFPTLIFNSILQTNNSLTCELDIMSILDKSLRVHICSVLFFSLHTTVSLALKIWSSATFKTNSFTYCSAFSTRSFFTTFHSIYI